MYIYICVSMCFCFSVADSTGTKSLYTTFEDYEIMFHVSTLLPYTANNTQQVSSSTSEDIGSYQFLSSTNYFQ